jgi:hypothetical protein
MIFDHARWADQRQATSELRGMFQVSDEGHPWQGPHAGNQVTPEEYENIVQMYSDLRLSTDPDNQHSNLRFGANSSAEYRQQTMQQIARILQTTSGRDLISHLEHSRSQTTLAGFDPNPELTGGASDRTFDEGASVRQADGNPGMGAPSEVHNLHTNEHATLPAGVAHPDWDPRSDVVLYHELTHAMHSVDGVQARGLVGHGTEDNAVARAEDTGVRNEEYQTVGLGRYERTDPMLRMGEISENAYRRERNEIGRNGAGAVAGDRDMTQRTSYLPAGTVEALRAQQSGQ